MSIVHLVIAKQKLFHILQKESNLGPFDHKSKLDKGCYPYMFIGVSFYHLGNKLINLYRSLDLYICILCYFSNVLVYFDVIFSRDFRCFCEMKVENFRLKTHLL